MNHLPEYQKWMIFTGTFAFVLICSVIALALAKAHPLFGMVFLVAVWAVMMGLFEFIIWWKGWNE